MATVIRMPSVLAGASEAIIAKWFVQPGDRVSVGEPFADLETEKAVVEYAAESDGILGRIIAAEGTTVAIGDPIAVLIVEGETDADIDSILGDEVSDSAPALEPEVTEVSVADAPETATAVAVAISVNGRQFASPIARKIARERGVDLATLIGSGPGGRIVRRDIEQAPAKQAANVPEIVNVVPVVASASEEISLSPMRKAIARRLTESKTTVPHFYLTAACKVDALLALREQINAQSPVRVSVNDLVVKAVALAFVDVPDANVTWGETVLHKHNTVDISVAVATEGGLVTPVVRDSAKKTLTEISTEIKDLVVRASEKRLRQEELEGGVFSISNLGMYGTKEFSAILNPPQSGILAVGAAIQEPVVVEGELQVATVMRCTLSADHRAVDGALAAQWLNAFTQRIENPISLLI